MRSHAKQRRRSIPDDPGPRHHRLKKRLTETGPPFGRGGLLAPIRRSEGFIVHRTARSGAQSRPVRGRHGASFAVVLTAAFAVGALAIGYIGFLLWPRWPATAAGADAPKLPITIAGELFVVAPAAIRIPLQRHAGPHERLDLAFLWPSLDAPDLGARPAAREEPPAPDRLFMTIAGADATLPPATRLKTIYPRYLTDEQFASGDGLVILNFRDGTPYQ